MNPDGSRYHNNGKGYSRYWAPDAAGDDCIVITNEFVGIELGETTKKVLQILGQPPDPVKREKMIAAMAVAKAEKAAAQQAEQERLRADRERRQQAERQRVRDERAQRREQGTQTEEHVETGMEFLSRVQEELLTRERRENAAREERERAERQQAERERAEKQQAERERLQRDLEATQARTEAMRLASLSPPASSTKRSAMDFDRESPDLYGGTPALPVTPPATPSKKMKTEPAVVVKEEPVVFVREERMGIVVVDLTQDDDTPPSSQEFYNTPSSMPSSSLSSSLPIRSRPAPPRFGLTSLIGRNAVTTGESHASQDVFV